MRPKGSPNPRSQTSFTLTKAGLDGLRRLAFRERISLSSYLSRIGQEAIKAPLEVGDPVRLRDIPGETGVILSIESDRATVKWALAAEASKPARHPIAWLPTLEFDAEAIGRLGQLRTTQQDPEVRPRS